MSDKHGTLILIQGLVGSGRPHLIEPLRYDFLIQENFAASESSEKRNIDDLARELRCGRCCIVSERKYCSNVERSTFIQKVTAAESPSPHPTIKVICFENDIETANHNCRTRKNKAHDPTGDGHVAQNDNDTRDYEIPADAHRI